MTNQRDIPMNEKQDVVKALKRIVKVWSYPSEFGGEAIDVKHLRKFIEDME